MALQDMDSPLLLPRAPAASDSQVPNEEEEEEEEERGPDEAGNQESKDRIEVARPEKVLEHIHGALVRIDGHAREHDARDAIAQGSEGGGNSGAGSRSREGRADILAHVLIEGRLGHVQDDLEVRCRGLHSTATTSASRSPVSPNPRWASGPGWASQPKNGVIFAPAVRLSSRHPLIRLHTSC